MMSDMDLQTYALEHAIEDIFATKSDGMLVFANKQFVNLPVLVHNQYHVGKVRGKILLTCALQWVRQCALHVVDAYGVKSGYNRKGNDDDSNNKHDTCCHHVCDGKFFAKIVYHELYSKW